MAVDIKKMVDAICSLTVLELCKLVKTLRDKFGLRTSARVREGANEVAETEAIVEEPTAVAKEPTEPEKESKPVPVEAPNAEDEPVDDPEKESKPVPDPSSVEAPDVDDVPVDEPVDEIKDAEADEVAERPTEVEEESNKSEKESKPVPDPSSVPDPGPSSVPVHNPPPVKRPEGENYNLVYTWRYSGDDRYAKIGETTKQLLPTRMPGTYHPTDELILIGTFKCNNKEHAIAVQNDILSKLKRVRDDREWVEIDDAFKEMVEKYFSNKESPH